MPRRAAAAAGLALAVAAASSPGCSPVRDRLSGRTARPLNLLLISIDTLRADHVSCYGYGKRTTPNIDALAGDGVRFALTATTAAFTVPAHASMMTGLFPSSHGATYQYDDPKRFSIRGMNHSYPTLAEILKERGYDTAAFVSCPLTGRQFGFSRGFATFDDRFDRLQTTPALLLSRSILFRGLERAGVFSEKDIDAERRADEVTPPAEAWVRARGSSPAPFFLFVHYYDPHAPYAPPDPFDRRPDSTRIAPAYEGRLLLRGDYTLTPVALDDTLALYDGEIRYVDRYVGNLLRTLKYTGSLDNAVVVLTSDHGESFGEHDHWAHTRVLYEDVLRVPFIVRLPGRAAAGSVVADVIAQPTDILSTVLSVAGLDPPANVEGRDLTRFIGRPPATAGDDVRPRRDVAFAEQMHDADSARRYGSRYARDLTSARTVRWKYIQASTGSEELYDLQNDAGEVSNLASIEPDALHAMRQLVGSWRKSLATIERGAQTDEVDEGTRYRLRGLGYVQ